MPEPNRQEHLESLFQRYPYFPKEVVLKEDILVEGLAADAAVQAVFQGRALCLEGGLFGLKRTIVLARWTHDSPYLLASRSGQLAVIDRASDARLAPARPYPDVPPGLEHCWNTLAADGEVMMTVTGSDGSLPISPDVAAAALAEVFSNTEWSPRERPLHVGLNSGETSSAGAHAETFSCHRYVTAIKQAIGNRHPLLLQCAPLPSEEEKLLHREGVNVRLSYLDAWDSRALASLQPGSERLVDWEEWVRRTLDQVYIYGDGRVLCRIMVGLEMALGRAGLSQTLESLTQGFQFLMSHGVIPLPVHPPAAVLPGKGAKLPVELFLEVDRIWYDTWCFYRMCEPVGFIVGAGRSRFPHGAALDVGRGAVLERPVAEKGVT